MLWCFTKFIYIHSCSYSCSQHGTFFFGRTIYTVFTCVRPAGFFFFFWIFYKVWAFHKASLCLFTEASLNCAQTTRPSITQLLSDESFYSLVPVASASLFVRKLPSLALSQSWSSFMLFKIPITLKLLTTVSNKTACHVLKIDVHSSCSSALRMCPKALCS